MATNNPRIRVREATPADIDAIVDIHFAAFDDNVMNQLMYPGGPSADSRAKFGANVFPRPESNAGDAAKKGQSILCVAEYLPEDATADTSGEVVAFAKWLLHREPRVEAEWKGEEFNATTESWGEGCDTAVVNAFIGEMTRIQRDHAKGEAALSSPVGYAVYKKFGYEDVDVLDLNVTETWGIANTAGSYWGERNAVSLAGPAADGVLRSVIMRRPATTR
ncbi:hypothetical protein NEMBOFW57_002880 [Staphylotrichum longicolle]|uniref:N-acetyltransferase domain-containing protein n=1 Tax=Staphylotrichum longicolle TaxID=669026 RepID=A0AAD4F549_9PEZI|nr:hypothetical protein NEMBOFW57_002880 [Staphylotrichum longicolle]